MRYNIKKEREAENTQAMSEAVLRSKIEILERQLKEVRATVETQKRQLQGGHKFMKSVPDSLRDLVLAGYQPHARAFVVDERDLMLLGITRDVDQGIRLILKADDVEAVKGFTKVKTKMQQIEDDLYRR